MVRGWRPMGGKGRDEERGKEKPGERGGGKRGKAWCGRSMKLKLFHSVGSAS